MLRRAWVCGRPSSISPRFVRSFRGRGKDVQVVGGADVIQQLMREGLVDGLHIDIMPVLLGDGLRLFAGDDLQVHDVRLEQLRVETVGQRAGLRFAVNR